MAGVNAVTSVQQFDEIKSASRAAVVVHFTAEWCNACKDVNVVLSELVQEVDAEHVCLVRVEAESLDELTRRYEVTAVPTIVFLKNGKEFDRMSGANAADLTKRVRQCNTGFVPSIPEVKLKAADFVSPAVAPPTDEQLNERLKRLINTATCMVFMKGSPQQPKCGFSKTLVDILDGFKADYSTFDILEDQTVREALKRYSNWPTYPQLYVKGELIGGVDIVKEMVAANELKPILPKKVDLNARLKSIINRSRIMVFMKGSRDQPKCKFSRQLLEIFQNFEGVEFDTFDILEDEAVRQGLKSYNNWPTYPQIYVNGDLIGGVDIIKEMKEAGELEGALKKKV